MNIITPFAVWEKVTCSDDTSGLVSILQSTPTFDGKALTIIFDAVIRLELQPTDDLYEIERSFTVNVSASLQKNANRWLLKNDFRYLLDKKRDASLEMQIATNKGTQLTLTTINTSGEGDFLAFYLPSATNNEICFKFNIRITRKRKQEGVIFELISLDLIFEEVKQLELPYEKI